MKSAFTQSPVEVYFVGSLGFISSSDLFTHGRINVMNLLAPRNIWQLSVMRALLPPSIFLERVMVASAHELLGQSKAIILKLLRKVEAMGSDIQMTPQSTLFRKRAQALGRAADIEQDHEALLILVKEALAWIQLAENEEALSFEPKNQ